MHLASGGRPGFTASTAIPTAVLTILTAASVCYGQGRVSEFLGVKNWHGTVKILGTGSGSTSGGAFSDVWQYGIVLLERQVDAYIRSKGGKP